jgi:hypothetical protein
VRSAPGRCEFVLWEHAQPPHLFIVRKQARIGPQVKLLACYYVLDGTIFPAPSLHDVISARTVRERPARTPVLAGRVPLASFLSTGLRSMGHSQMRCVHSLRAAFDTLGKALNPKVEAARKRRKAEHGSGEPSTPGACSGALAVDPAAYKSAKRRNMVIQRSPCFESFPFNRTLHVQTLR